MIRFERFSKKQLKIMSWWMKDSPHKDANGIIADGSIRAGKTLAMSISFCVWSMSRFNGQQFGMSGKTVSSFKRNVIFWLLPILKLRGYKCNYSNSENILTISRKEKDGTRTINYYYIYGGRDESSYMLIQGMTAAGWFFDEVALQPETFVNQAIGRCSVEDSKIWFNCNPDKPNHWFKKDFIDKAKEKGYYHIHFLMEDNPSLSKKTIAKYKANFTGVFFNRYILGLWSLAEGIIYDMFNEEDHTYDYELTPEVKWRSQRYIVLDYGTTNPLAAYDVYIDFNYKIAYFDDEYYYDSKEERNHGKQKTDKEYADDIQEFIKRNPQPVLRIIVDPSATSFKAELRSRGLAVKDADNEVLAGLRRVSSALHTKRIKFHKRCKKAIEEFGAYIWDEKARDRGIEQPLKTFDHAMDAIRYLVNTMLKKYIDRGW